MPGVQQVSGGKKPLGYGQQETQIERGGTQLARSSTNFWWGRTPGLRTTGIPGREVAVRNPACQEFNKFLVGRTPGLRTTGNSGREVAVKNPACQVFNKFLVGENPWVTDNRLPR